MYRYLGKSNKKLYWVLSERPPQLSSKFSRLHANILDEVVFYIDMLCLLMVLIIRAMGNWSLVISMNSNRFGKWQSNFTKILAYPKCLGCSLREHHIFGLYSWKHQSSVSCSSMILVLLPVTNFIWIITLGILDQFWQSKWPPKSLKKTFQMVPKMSQSNQYSPSYQQISQWLPSHQTLNCWYLRNRLM